MGEVRNIMSDCDSNDRRKAGYDYLATAIIEQTILDYCHAVRRIEKLKVKREVMRNTKFRDQKPNETKKQYYEYCYLHRPEYCDKQIWHQQEEINSCIKFFNGTWLKAISDLDGNKLLTRCNEALKKEGLEV